MKDDELCVCGSGRTFESCCKPYIHSTVEMFCTEIEKHNYIKAYYIAIAMMSEYLLKIKKHTVELLKYEHPFGKVLLEVDIQAFKELMERIYGVLIRHNIHDDWGKRLDNIKDIVNVVSWEQSCAYYQLVYYNMKNKNGKYEDEIKNIISASDITQIQDVDFLMELYSVYPIEGSLTKALNILECIIKLTSDDFLKLKYTFDKAIRLVMVCDEEAAIIEAKKTMDLLEKRIIDWNNSYEVVMTANIYEMYYHFSGKEEHLHKSRSILENLDIANLNAAGKAHYYCQLGYVNWRLNDYEKAASAFSSSLAYEDNMFSQIYLVDCKINMKEIVSLERYLEQTNLTEIGKDTFDFLFIMGNSAIELNDIKSMGIIRDYIKQVDFTGAPYFNNCIKELEIALEQKRGIRGLLSKLKPISKYLILQPNISGFGIDLKQMMDDITEN